MADDPVGSSASTRDNLTFGAEAADAVVLRVDSAWVVRSVEGNGALSEKLAGLAGRNLLEARPDLVGTPVQEQLAAAMAGRSSPMVEGYCGVMGVWIEIVAWPAGGGSVSLICRDVSAQHAPDEGRDWLKASGTKDKFLAVLTHELRTPLTPVLLAASMLERNPSLPSDAKEAAAGIRRNVEMEAKLIDDLADLDRVVRGTLPLRLETADVHRLIGYGLHVAREEILAKRIWLRMDLRATRHAVRADPARLQQVLWTLIRNAVRFTPDGGTLIVRSRDEAGGTLRVEVQDTGVGIEAGELARIFDAFGEGGRPGATGDPGGVGLAICKALVEMHGGRIRAESAGPGRGATFVLELPLEQVAAGAAGPAVGASDIARRLAILVVEDHASTAEMLATALTALGHDVATAASVGEANRAVAGRRFDLLISDVGLPDGSGLDLMEALRREVPGAKGIALSGYGMEEDLRRSAAAGFAEHLTKPVAVGTLKEAIERVTG
jgi:CheY-like chemotaxis protein/nitrogen-specific signal transduction histidine kinase